MYKGYSCMDMVDRCASIVGRSLAGRRTGELCIVCSLQSIV